MSSYKEMLQQLDPRQVALKTALQKAILNNPTLIGVYPNHNASAKDAMRIQRSDGPTIPAGSYVFQGGVIPPDPVTNSVQNTTGSGYTGGWRGPIFNSVGYFDRGNWSGQTNAGVPDANKQSDLYQKLYNKHHNMALSAAIQKSAAELRYEQSHDKYGQQTTESSQSSSPRPGAAPAA